MRILAKDLKHGVKVRIEHLDDLWAFSQVIEAGDTLAGKTLRKIKVADREGNVTSVRREPVFLTIEVLQVEFQEPNLRVSGKVLLGPEDVPRGSHHGFTLEEGSVVTLQKVEWPRFQLQRLEEACESAEKVLVCVLDREEAILAIFERRGIRTLSKLRGNEPGKRDASSRGEGQFFQEVAAAVQEASERHAAAHVVLASPSFWREEVAKLLPALKGRMTLAGCTSATESALQELSRRPELRTALREQRLYQETQLMERLKEAIAKREPAAYGRKEVELAVRAGAVSMLLVSSAAMTRAREEGWDLDGLMRYAERCKGEVHILDSAQGAGAELDALGGIGALLRYHLGGDS